MKLLAAQRKNISPRSLLRLSANLVENSVCEVAQYSVQKKLIRVVLRMLQEKLVVVNRHSSQLSLGPVFDSLGYLACLL